MPRCEQCILQSRSTIPTLRVPAGFGACCAQRALRRVFLPAPLRRARLGPDHAPTGRWRPGAAKPRARVWTRW
eukprot:gene13868-biopygen14131